MDTGRCPAKGEIAQGFRYASVRSNRDPSCKGEPLQGAVMPRTGGGGFFMSRANAFRVLQGERERVRATCDVRTVSVYRECLDTIESTAVRRRHPCFARHEEARPVTLAGRAAVACLAINEVSWSVAGVFSKLALRHCHLLGPLLSPRTPVPRYLDGARSCAARSAA